MSVISYSETIDQELLKQYQELLGSSGLKESLETLKSLMPTYYDELCQYYQAEDESAFRRQAHKMKGACRSLGFARLGEAMAFLEKETWQWQQAAEVMSLWSNWLVDDLAEVEYWLEAQ